MKKYKLFELIDGKIVERYIKGNPDPDKYCEVPRLGNEEDEKLSTLFPNIILVTDLLNFIKIRVKGDCISMDEI